MPDNETLLLEIEAAKIRHDWAQAQLEQHGHLSSFRNYAEQSQDELRALMVLVKPRRPLKPTAS